MENWKEVGESLIKFDEHVKQSIIYPSVDDPNSRFHIVPINIFISKNGNLDHIECNNNPPPPVGMSMYNYDSCFVQAAFKVIESFKQWVPEYKNKQYQFTKKYLPIQFYYHKNVFTDTTVILNPDKRTRYPQINRKYEYLINGKFGCDGIGYILAIIDETGMPYSLECLHTVGKTNAKIVQQEFLSLGNWEPALLHGKAVKSTLHTTVYV